MFEKTLKTYENTSLYREKPAAIMGGRDRRLNNDKNKKKIRMTLTALEPTTT